MIMIMIMINELESQETLQVQVEPVGLLER